MKIIVGLGNPEDKYAGTRHNLGFMVLNQLVADRLPSTASDKFWELNKKFKAVVGSLKTENLLLAKPQTYMNNSGMAVAAIVNYYKIKAEDLIVVHDELDLPLGKIKVRRGGSGAGHHGIESIIQALGTDNFIRVRLGIGNLRSQSAESGGQHFNSDHFVLESFMPNERSKVKHMVKQAVKALDLLIAEGLSKAQNEFN